MPAPLLLLDCWETAACSGWDGGCTGASRRGKAERALLRTVINNAATCLQCWLVFWNAGQVQLEVMPSPPSRIATSYGSGSEPFTRPCALDSLTLTSSTTLRFS